MFIPFLSLYIAVCLCLLEFWSILPITLYNYQSFISIHLPIKSILLCFISPSVFIFICLPHLPSFWSFQNSHPHNLHPVIHPLVSSPHSFSCLHTFSSKHPFPQPCHAFIPSLSSLHTTANPPRPNQTSPPNPAQPTHFFT